MLAKITARQMICLVDFFGLQTGRQIEINKLVYCSINSVYCHRLWSLCSSTGYTGIHKFKFILNRAGESDLI